MSVNGNQELYKKLDDIQNDLHRLENAFNDIELKVHNLKWDIFEGQKEIFLKDGSIERKKVGKPL